ncbi:hypothetical protein [Halovivax limisalsi]|uniref:hypothetical protein n=1 Tax=Halovivax limisalsi TaxID=1453760 RepID=UPI001FFD9736|nr:hypothetical protein [Halovivax limisalsi]
MTVLVADTSALVSLGIVAKHETSPLSRILDSSQVCIPERVVSELETTAAYDDRSAAAARDVLDHLSRFSVQPAELEEDFPLDDGENAAVSLANDLDATQFLCDEFNRLALVHVSLADTRLVTTPTLLTALVRNERLDPSAAEDLLSTMRDARSWESNTYVEQARLTLGRQKR